MNFFISHIKQLDWILIIAAILLVAIGLVSIYSSSLAHGDFSNFTKQIVFLGIAFFLMILFSFLDWRIFKEDPYLILLLYFICIIALIGLFFFAPEIRGVKSWYKLGPFSFDPIEMTKIILIILLAKYFSMRHIEMYKVRHIIFSGIYFLAPLVLIFFQPNMGAVLILGLLWVGILIISGIRLRHFLILVLCGILAISLGWITVLKDYQKERVLSFINPTDPLGTSWNQNQAKIAIGSGGLWGKGIGNGSQTQYGFLPETHNDFIFASLAEELGLIGVSVIFLLFLALISRIIKIAISSQSNFPRLFASGLAIILILQIFINIGMNIGILPIIGISLPFISYGGSGLISMFIGIGILQSIKKN